MWSGGTRVGIRWGSDSHLIADRRQLVALNYQSLGVDGDGVGIHIGVCEGEINAFHPAIRGLFGMEQYARLAASGAAELGIKTHVLVRTVQDKPTAAWLLGRSDQFAVIRMPFRLA